MFDTVRKFRNFFLKTFCVYRKVQKTVKALILVFTLDKLGVSIHITISLTLKHQPKNLASFAPSGNGSSNASASARCTAQIRGILPSIPTGI